MSATLDVLYTGDKRKRHIGKTVERVKTVLLVKTGSCGKDWLVKLAQENNRTLFGYSKEGAIQEFNIKAQIAAIYKLARQHIPEMAARGETTCTTRPLAASARFVYSIDIFRACEHAVIVPPSPAGEHFLVKSLVFTASKVAAR